MAEREKRPMTRRQAENLAKGNPALKARIDAGEFDTAPAAPGRSPGKPRKPPVSAGAPPARPRARSSSSPGSPRPPRPSRDNGQPDPEKRPGAVRSFFGGLFDI